MAKSINDGKNYCLVPGCERTPRSRGLCDTHYTRLAVLVKAGKYTWEQLVRSGKALETKHRGASVGMAKWLEDVK